MIWHPQFNAGIVMEPPTSNDVVKEACAPLADIDSADEVCHPVQQPQTHSIPHSSPSVGPAGIDPTSHREERMNERSKEEVDEELEHKAKKKHGESGQDSDECILEQVCLCFLLRVRNYCSITMNCHLNELTVYRILS